MRLDLGNAVRSASGSGSRVADSGALLGWSNWVWAPLLLLCGLAVSRLFFVLSLSIGYDEAITLIETSGSANALWPTSPTPVREVRKQLSGVVSLDNLVRVLRERDVHPPLYFVVLAYWRAAFGWQLETARLLSLILSLAGVFLLYKLCQSRMQFPLVPALIFGISTIGIASGIEARGYALAQALMLGAAVVAAGGKADSTSERSLLRSMVVGTLCGLAFATHYFTVFGSSAILAWYVLRNRQWSAILKLGLPAGAVFFLIGATMVFFLHKQLGARPDQYAGFTSIARETIFVARALVRGLTDATGMGLVDKLALVPLLAVLGIGALALIQASSRVGSIVLLAWLVLLINCAGLLALFAFTDKTLVHQHAFRYLGFATPFAAIAVAAGLEYLHARSATIGAICLAGVVVSQALTWVDGRMSERPWGEPWRSFAQEVASAGADRALVAVPSGHGRGVQGCVVVELPPETHFVSMGAEPPSYLTSLARNYSHIWVLDAEPGFSNAALDHSINTMLREGAAEVPTKARVHMQRPLYRHIKVN